VSARPVVAIYRHQLLVRSETFIREQAEAMKRFATVYVGLRVTDGLTLPPERVVTADRGTGARLGVLAARLGVPDRTFVDGIRRHSPSLIHAHFEGGGIVALPIARALGIPLVVTCHGFDVTMDDRARMPNPLLRRYYVRRRLGLQRSGAFFIAVSEHIRRAMLGRGYRADRIRLHRIGVDTSRITPGPAADREPFVLFVGRLVEKKGAEYLIRAMSSVATRVPGASAVIVGDGPLRGSLEALSRTLDAPVRFRGSVAWNDVIELMRRARVLSVPTVRAANGDMDGCAMVLAEAQAAGLPVVSFASGGTPEAVIDGRTGWLAPERDVDTLADRIVDLLKDDERWLAFSEAARTHVSCEFNVRRQTDLLEGLYDEILEDHRRT
jgi:glycosyltransferase involved in cell wall biosynthesis